VTETTRAVLGVKTAAGIRPALQMLAPSHEPTWE
jgi:hypothetical protein